MEAAVLNPLAPTPRGMWSGHGIRVRRRRGPHRPHVGGETVCTPHFCVQRHGRLLTVEHNLLPDELCDELAVMLAEELVDIGALHGQSEFELVFTGIVRSTVDGGLSAWLRFYRNSVDRLEAGTTAFAPIHAWAAGEVRGHRLIDLGSCFGFFPLRMARRGIEVFATDLSAPTMHLLRQISTAMRRPLTTLACDAAEVPLPDRCADTVTALHLIEHLPTDAVDAVLDEAIRLARRRVVVGVPFEDEPRDCYGHIQRFDLTTLQRTAERLTRRHPAISARAYEFHGGWLILDR
ncbi:class I SAM-dependent methyltransferase [Mycobacterium sp. Y57]|uniref:mycofactocin oligosaccharide methyltransferase MftM n=1 Tax=Mycolicibacterium xanthum TaxID=2796469 RepID=UPI001C8447A8|nr:mycofactocin oligosaccharide methyltransferase MftM [Mycolicibacterium xanthum]MBX7431188.1 class I SAM-dependent methyltransferase [Mycolicibacterium xanthum]